MTFAFAQHVTIPHCVPDWLFQEKITNWVAWLWSSALRLIDWEVVGSNPGQVRLKAVQILPIADLPWVQYRSCPLLSYGIGQMWRLLSHLLGVQVIHSTGSSSLVEQWVTWDFFYLNHDKVRFSFSWNDLNWRKNIFKLSQILWRDLTLLWLVEEAMVAEKSFFWT